jgi:membrane protein
MRMAYAVVRDVVDGRLALHAASLVYTTILSLVPLIALAFSVLKGFGVHYRLENLLLTGLAPLGKEAPVITERLISFVDKMDVGVLGTVGLALLFYTAISADAEHNDLQVRGTSSRSAEAHSVEPAPVAARGRAY